MIPRNIGREHVIKAIEEIQRIGFPKNRSSRKYSLKHNGRYYPPKYVVSSLISTSTVGCWIPPNLMQVTQMVF